MTFNKINIALGKEKSGAGFAISFPFPWTGGGVELVLYRMDTANKLNEKTHPSDPNLETAA